jgi:hypothetical protein
MLISAAQDVAGGVAPGFGQLAEGVVGIGTQLAQAVFKVGGVPERFRRRSLLAVCAQVKRLHEDDQPAGQRHAQQNDCHGAGDPVTLRPDVGQSKLRIHKETPKTIA